ncbi:hypothetical protein SPBR_01853 [Sporothrix brasiliensis 5110]|uniref:Uncharacterized protein n=1 Tax=Sporothrix brasiliensis 5110 TaxID=1398154 RepID=A0A0C2IYU4_9PEZI|nr:uncharacterized protein SPBR_01853 [Sporothrix brasiliensis 5110]KIH91890.1 hypothetical protein SPBR_01853 [Sporothrix brasiliensis 5110]
MSMSIPSPAAISVEAFAEYLGRYPDVIATVSAAKGAKPGQKSLLELDEYRYVTAPATFGHHPGGRHKIATRDDVLTLVEWKLRHGKFRPTLMKLVESNPTATLQETIREAGKKFFAATCTVPVRDVRLPARDGAALRSVKMLCELKGIGPATASLLLAVHYPKEVIFFSDEVYAWLCGGASHNPPSKYNAKEYESVVDGMLALVRRLPEEFGPLDVEKVAYVVMYDKKNGSTVVKVDKMDKTVKPETTKDAKTADDAKDAGPGKRKAEQLAYLVQGIDTKWRKPHSEKAAPKAAAKAAPASTRTRRSSRLQKSS